MNKCKFHTYTLKGSMADQNFEMTLLLHKYYK